MTNSNAVLQALKRKRRLDLRQIREMLNCNNPADVIYKLRRRGHNILDAVRRKGSRSWKVYWLA